MKFTASKIEPRIKVKFNTRDEVYNWGADNCYPALCERLIQGSPTASQSARAYSKFIYGKGWSDMNFYKYPIGKNAIQIETPDSLLRKTAEDISKFRCYAWLIGYNLLGEVASITHVPAKWVRLGQVDSDLYSGKLIVYNNWDKTLKTQVNTKDFKTFDAYNPRQDVIEAQMIAAGGIENWGGQLLFRSLDDSYLYPLSPVDPVIHDVDTEAQSSLIKNKKVRRGFHTSAIIQHAPFESEEDEDAFAETIENSLGAESAGGVILLEDKFTSDQPNGNMRITPMTADLDSKGLEYSEKSIANNIRKCFNNLPPVLVDYVEGSLGNTSGEILKMAIEFYNLQTEQERQVVEADFNDLIANYWQALGQNWTIQPMTADNGEDVFEQENLKAQAALRGSVGGVQGIIQIQQSVSDGITSRQSGVSMLVNIYGFELEVARTILGDVTEEAQP